MISTCIVGIKGYSGSGKTTLIRKILPILKEQGLSVGVLKHIHHNLNIYIREKDTDYFYRAGADFVFAHDSYQGFTRFHSNDETLDSCLDKFPAALDLIIVEGHKDIDVPGIWLTTKASKRMNFGPACGGKAVVSRCDPEYHLMALKYIQQSLAISLFERPVHAGLLIGGKSSRMGTSKAFLKIKGRTLAGNSFNVPSSVAEKTVLLGSGQMPRSLKAADRLCDVSDMQGPLSGMLSAFRWAPKGAWIISSVDMPFMCEEAWNWLLSQRKPGVWAVLPKIKGSRGVETTGAVYEPVIFDYVESIVKDGSSKLQDIAKNPKVIAPTIPASLTYVWKNVNTRSDWKKVVRLAEKKR